MVRVGLAAVVGLVVAGMVLAGCGPPTDPSTPQASGSPSGAAVSSSISPNPSANAGSPRGTVSPGRSSQPQPGTTYTGSKSVGQVTIRGQATDGVESGCVVLAADDGMTYLLLGGDRTVIGGGGRLEVVGEPQPDLLTTCQQGTPFQVSSVRRI